MIAEASPAERELSTTTRSRVAVGRLRRFWGPTLVALASFVGMAYVVAHDPNVPGGGIGECPLHSATGYWCPGCGGTRAAYAIAHGDLLGALSMNLLLTLAIPFLAVLWIRWVMRLSGRSLKEWPFPSWAGAALGGVILGFFVLRNVPFFSPLLAP